MEIVINAGFLESLIPEILFLGGALLILIYILRLINRYIKKRKKAKKEKGKNYICLTIDVPKDNDQGPEAVERMFAHLAGIDKKDKISLEIVGKEGEIQFFIYLASCYRDLVEAAIYTAYPSAEILEVEDYTKEVPEEFPNNDIDVWAADLNLTNPSPYPIRTYPDFEHKLSKSFKDPMIDFLEVLGRLRPGEQVWIQIIISPAEKKLKEN